MCVIDALRRHPVVASTSSGTSAATTSSSSPIPLWPRTLAQRLVDRFDSIVAGLHDDTDNDRAWIEATDRMGNLTRTPLMSLSIGIAKSRANRFMTAAEIAATASEMKAFAKRQPGSSWAIDRRRS